MDLCCCLCRGEPYGRLYKDTFYSLYRCMWGCFLKNCVYFGLNSCFWHVIWSQDATPCRCLFHQSHSLKAPFCFPPLSLFLHEPALFIPYIYFLVVGNFLSHSLCYWSCGRRVRMQSMHHNMGIVEQTHVNRVGVGWLLPQSSEG